MAPFKLSDLVNVSNFPYILPSQPFQVMGFNECALFPHALDLELYHFINICTIYIYPYFSIFKLLVCIIYITNAWNDISLWRDVFMFSGVCYISNVDIGPSYYHEDKFSVSLDLILVFKEKNGPHKL